ncbi:hypothetical protein Pfo_000634 [Paulownia fortunei]|nr:hypothetical protein Pfo_000634 [Paulownia fortunei]
MGDKYAECHKYRSHSDGKSDGCQEFMEKKGWISMDCDNCGCHRNFHRKVEVVYTKCHKNHDFKFPSSVDGCQEFTPSGREGTEAAVACAACGCHKAFHRNEVHKPVTSTSKGF